jgi:hypothetical protein
MLLRSGQRVGCRDLEQPPRLYLLSSSGKFLSITPAMVVGLRIDEVP